VCSEIEIKEAMDVLMKFGLKKHYFNITLCNTGISNAMKDKSKGDVINSENFEYKLVIPIILWY
jgi:N-acetylneuraminate synthase/N,N'-diacetyllegionaminate synthase